MLSRPVVSIGNLSMGGTGKTPLAGHVARLLRSFGHKPAILSRGYARPSLLEGAVVVSDGDRVLADYATAGDEPLMLARQLAGCAVVVAADRYLAGAIAERRLGCTVHVLDDGFQHLRLARTLDLVVLSARDLDDAVLPFGRLREPLDAVGEADGVVVHAEEGIEAAARAAGARRVFSMYRRLGGACRDAPALAFAGIALPAAFFDSLARDGWTIAARVPFADHHRYSAADLARLAERAKTAGAALLVTTEKDAARLAVREIAGLPLVVAPLEIAVEPAAEFASLLRASCPPPSGGAASW